MHANGSRHLRKACDAFLDVRTLKHHEIRELVDENQDIR